MDTDTGVDDDPSMKRNRKPLPKLAMLIRMSTNGTIVATMVVIHVHLIIVTTTGTIVDVVTLAKTRRRRKPITPDGDLTVETTTVDILIASILITMATIRHRLILIPTVTE